MIVGWAVIAELEPQSSALWKAPSSLVIHDRPIKTFPANTMK